MAVIDHQKELPHHGVLNLNDHQPSPYMTVLRQCGLSILSSQSSCPVSLCRNVLVSNRLLMSNAKTVSI